MNWRLGLRVRSVRHLTRIAAVLALIGLAIIAYSILSPRPLPVILAMSVGQLFGAVALVCYFLAVVLDVSRKPAGPDSLAPPPVEPKKTDD